MGKRYGRNQKRRHRERIAELESAYKRELELVKYHSNERQKYQGLYEEITHEFRQWWDNSVLLDVPEEIVPELPPEYRIAQRKSLQIPFAQSGPTSTIDFHYRTLAAYRIASERDYGMRCMHMRLCTPKNEFAYYLDTRTFEVWDRMPIQMEREVCRAICFEFNKQLRDAN